MNQSFDLTTCSVPNNVPELLSIKQENGEEVAVHYSGNPGYVVGLPLVSGTRTAEYPLPAWTLDFPPLDLPTV